MSEELGREIVGLTTRRSTGGIPLEVTTSTGSFSLSTLSKPHKQNNKNDSMKIGRSSQLEKHGFGSLHNLMRTCYLNYDILFRH